MSAALPAAAFPTTTESPLHVVVVSGALPSLTPIAGSPSLLGHMLRLARRHRLTWIGHAQADLVETLRTRAFLLENGIRTVAVDGPLPGTRGFRFGWHLATNGLSGLPASVTLQCTRGLRRAVREYAANNRVDLWHCEGTPAADAVRALPAARWLVQAAHIESERLQNWSEHQAPSMVRWFMNLQQGKCARYERQIFQGAAATLVARKDDAELAHWAFGVSQVERVEPGIEMSYYLPPTIPRRRKEVLFVGNLQEWSQVDALTMLLKDVWPMVARTDPLANLRIVGDGAPTRLRRHAATLPRVDWPTGVTDVRPFLATCAVVAAPLRITDGPGLPILEALACECPVVTTPVGAAVVELTADEHLTVVPDAEQLARAVLAVLHAPEPAQEQARRGRDFVAQKHNGDALAGKLEQVWLRCMTGTARMPVMPIDAPAAALETEPAAMLPAA